MFNSCLIVHDQFQPTDIVKTIWFTLQSSATMCVFSPYVQPLAELQEMLIHQKMAANVKIEELWTREHQVLPMRTHPNMSMHGASGFILSAIKVN
jgi:tRNA (adenine-N(1)-)-methyltransferase non-catalytic subunit